jgi:hypothetical protein
MIEMPWAVEPDPLPAMIFMAPAASAKPVRSETEPELCAALPEETATDPLVAVLVSEDATTTSPLTFPWLVPL